LKSWQCFNYHIKVNIYTYRKVSLDLKQIYIFVFREQDYLICSNAF
jgi:hypothetical protein